MKNDEKNIQCFCTVCDKPFLAGNKKAMYCSKGCSYKGLHQQDRVRKSVGLLWEIERSALMKRQDALMQILSQVIGFIIPRNMIPAENKIDLKELGFQLAGMITKSDKRNEKFTKVSKLKLKNQKQGTIQPKKSNITTKMQVEVKAQEKVSEIDYAKLKVELKTLFTKTIQKNTGKFPIFPPQIGGKIDKIIDTIIPKIEGNVNNQIIIEYIEQRITDITTMIDERHF